MYQGNVPKLLSDLVMPQQIAPAAALKPRTLTERQAVRLEMTKLNERILSGFRSRARYQQPRRDYTDV
jgi:hypothetical protein